jgi:hypothetical protein
LQPFLSSSSLLILLRALQTLQPVYGGGPTSVTSLSRLGAFTLRSHATIAADLLTTANLKLHALLSRLTVTTLDPATTLFNAMAGDDTAVASMTSGQTMAIEVCTRTMSVLSLFGSAYIIGTFVSFPFFRKRTYPSFYDWRRR